MKLKIKDTISHLTDKAYDENSLAAMQYAQAILSLTQALLNIENNNLDS